MRYPIPFLLIALVLSSCSYSDLRTDLLKEPYEQDQLEQKARQILERAKRVHGLANLSQCQTYELTVTDDWPGLVGKFINPWPVADAAMKLRYVVGDFDGQVEFLEGEVAGEKRGIQSWQYYEQPAEGEADFSVKTDDGLVFILPAYQYFSELVLRLEQAPLLLFAGEKEYAGQSYDLVFATWKGAEPQPDLDQYLMYFNRETGRLDLCSYTLRDNPPIAKKLYGTILFQDYREVNGIWFPFDQTVLSNEPEPGKKYLHRLQVTKLAFDTFSPDEIRPREDLKPMGDSKP